MMHLYPSKRVGFDYFHLINVTRHCQYEYSKKYFALGPETVDKVFLSRCNFYKTGKLSIFVSGGRNLGDDHSLVFIAQHLFHLRKWIGLT